MRKLFCIFSIILLCACSSVPSLEKIFLMSPEEAQKRLSGLDQETLRKAWGDPSSFFSGLYGDIYEDPDKKDKLIGVVYDPETKKVQYITFFDRQK